MQVLITSQRDYIPLAMSLWVKTVKTWTNLKASSIFPWSKCQELYRPVDDVSTKVTKVFKEQKSMCFDLLVN